MVGVLYWMMQAGRTLEAFVFYLYVILYDEYALAFSLLLSKWTVVVFTDKYFVLLVCMDHMKLIMTAGTNNFLFCFCFCLIASQNVFFLT